MAAPTNITQTVSLALEYQNTLAAFNSMIAAANAFITAANILAADPQFSIASSAFKTWGTTVLSQVSTFVQNTSTPPPA